METGRSCRARWRIAEAANNIHVLIGLITCQSSSLRTVNAHIWKMFKAKFQSIKPFLRAKSNNNCLCSPLHSWKKSQWHPVLKTKDVISAVASCWLNLLLLMRPEIIIWSRFRPALREMPCSFFVLRSKEVHNVHWLLPALGVQTCSKLLTTSTIDPCRHTAAQFAA